MQYTDVYIATYHSNQPIDYKKSENNKWVQKLWKALIGNLMKINENVNE